MSFVTGDFFLYRLNSTDTAAVALDFSGSSLTEGSRFHASRFFGSRFHGSRFHGSRFHASRFHASRFHTGLEAGPSLTVYAECGPRAGSG